MCTAPTISAHLSSLAFINAFYNSRFIFFRHDNLPFQEREKGRVCIMYVTLDLATLKRLMAKSLLRFACHLHNKGIDIYHSLLFSSAPSSPFRISFLGASSNDSIDNNNYRIFM